MGLTLYSCSDFLDEHSKGSMNASTYPKTDEDMVTAMSPMWWVFMEMTGGDDPMFFFLAADDATSNVPANTYFRDGDIFNISDGLSQLQDDWQLPYKGIQVSNFIIARYKDCTGDQDLINSCAGQAYFTRAWWYFWLVKYYGPCPMPLKEAESDTEMKQSSVEEIYEQIIADLQEAERLLPVQQTRSEWLWNGMSMVPTKGSAQALLASVYLQMTGWPLKDTSKYALAAAKAGEVIDNEATYGYGLVDIHDLWSGLTLWDKEYVFGYPYNWRDGDYTMRTPKAGAPLEEGGWACYMAEINFFKNFPEGPRKDVTFQTDIWVPVSDGSVAGSFYDARSDGWYIDVPWDDSRTQKQHPYYCKQRFGTDANGGCISWDDRYTSNWRSGRSQRFIRYAEVLLVYAEAQCMAKGAPDASAYNAINRVRERAGLADLPSGLSAADFQKACFDERGWEFAGNEWCSRWSDLLRFEKVEEANSNRDPREYELNHTPTKADYYLPIPAYDKNKNPNLKDNIGQ